MNYLNFNIMKWIKLNWAIIYQKSNKQFLIESLSDSTIYMAYYTIANYLHEDIYGLKPKNVILPEMLTEEVFDYKYVMLSTKNTFS